MKPALSPLSEGSTAQFAILVLAFIVFPYAGFLYLIVADAGLFRTVVAPLARKPGIDPFENGLLPVRSRSGSCVIPNGSARI